MTVDEMLSAFITLQKLGYGDKQVYLQDSEYGTEEADLPYLTKDNLIVIDPA